VTERPTTHAILDAGRGTLTLPRRLVPVAMLLRHRGRGATDAASIRGVKELERAGIAYDGRLHPMAASMLGTVTDPRLVITVEVTVDGPPEISTLWAAAGRVVLGRPVEPDLFQLSPLEPEYLPFHLAQLTRVGIRPDPPFTGSVAVPDGLLDDLATAWDSDVDGAVDRLRGAGVDPTWADRLAIAHHHRRRTWRVASLWAGPDRSAHDHELTVLDAGPAGYWVIRPGDEGPSAVTLQVATFAEIIDALRHTIPRGWET
jgi:hypothetical protein